MKLVKKEIIIRAAKLENIFDKLRVVVLILLEDA